MQQPSTPTMNGWTKDEVRLSKKERKEERRVHDIRMDAIVTPQLQGHVLLRPPKKVS